MDADQLLEFQEGLKEIFRDWLKDVNLSIRSREAAFETVGSSEGCSDTTVASSSTFSEDIYQPSDKTQPSSFVVNNLDTETISTNMVDNNILEECEQVRSLLDSVRLAASAPVIATAHAARQFGPLPVLASLRLPNLLTEGPRYKTSLEENPCHAANVQQVVTLACAVLARAAPRLYDG